MLKPDFWKNSFGTALIALTVLIILSSACSAPSTEPQDNESPLILSLEAQYPSVYPSSASEIQCIASDPDGDQLSFTWSCTGGSLIGIGPAVTWESPDNYGDYYIMVIAQDSNGHSAKETLTVTVVARTPNSKGCCGR